MNFKIAGIKRDMGFLNDGLKVDMEAMMSFKIEELKEDLAKLLEERCHSYDKEIHGSHDEDKRNINYGFRDANVGFKNHHIANIDMKKFDGKDRIAWILMVCGFLWCGF